MLIPDDNDFLYLLGDGRVRTTKRSAMIREDIDAEHEASEWLAFDGEVCLQWLDVTEAFDEHD